MKSNKFFITQTYILQETRLAQILKNDLLIKEIPSKNVQDRIIDEILIQSGGVGLGIVFSIITSLFVLKWSGVYSFFGAWLKKEENEAEAIRALVISLQSLVISSGINDKTILNELGEIKILANTIIAKIERNERTNRK